METAFYEATAQILPVLLLALVVEYRLFQRDRYSDQPAWLSTSIATAWYAVATTFMFGEYFALYVLATGLPVNRAADNVIVLAYLMGVVTLVIPLLDTSSREGKRLGRLRGLVVQLALAAALMAGGYGLVELLR